MNTSKPHRPPNTATIGKTILASTSSKNASSGLAEGDCVGAPVAATFPSIRQKISCSSIRLLP
eukprot:snap_masked-scaffold_18-processed-gene-2.45-mRNA-1 protein AED:1.00 eAED:1.00 QI:0/-1/0/0/-1/1/1/0/62